MLHLLEDESRDAPGGGVDEAELIEGIADRPDADEPRKVYADWLDEHGRSARARFVRVQLASAGLPEWDPRQVELRVQEDLLAAERKQWELRWPGRDDGVRVSGWERGLPATAEVDSFATLAGVQDRLARLGVQELRVPLPRSPDEALAVGAIASVRRLEVTNRPGELGTSLRWLFESPLVDRLDSLAFSLAGPLRRGALEGVVGWAGWRRLRRFSLFRARMDDDDLAWLLDALPESLASLGFGVSMPLDGDGSLVYDDHPQPLELLAAWPGLSRIERLDVFLTRPGEQGIAELLASPHATALRDLGLNIVARALTFPASPSAPLRLETLRILHGELGRGLGEDLASAGCLAGLKHLRLRGIRVAPAEVFRAMVRGPFRRTLQVIDDAGTEDGNGALSGLLEGLAVGNFERLHSLSLGRSVVASSFERKHTLDRRLEELVATSVSNTLRELVLRDHQPGDPHVSGLTLLKVLQASPQLRRVRVPTALKANEAEALRRHPRVRELVASGGLSGDILRSSQLPDTLRR